MTQPGMVAIQAAWRAGHRQTPAPARSTEGDVPNWPAAGQPLKIRVLLAPDADPDADPDLWGWIDFSGNSRVRSTQRVVITRGRANEQTQTPPSTAQLTFDNRDGALSPRNVASPYHGLFGVNTPLRIQVNRGTGWHTRFTGQVPSWSPVNDTTQRDRTMPVNPSGILRRLQQGSPPSHSPLYRANLIRAADIDTGVGTPISYVPAEDEAGATIAASAIGSNGMIPNGLVTFASSGPPGSVALPNLTTGATLGGFLTNSAVTDRWAVGFVFRIPSAITGSGTIFRAYGTGTADHCVISFAHGSPDLLQFTGYSSTASLFNETIAFTLSDLVTPAYGTWIYLIMSAFTVAGATTYRVDYTIPDPTSIFRGSVSSFGFDVLSGSAGALTRWTACCTGGVGSVDIGHFVHWDDFRDPVLFAIQSGVMANAAIGWVGESSARRFRRLAREQKIPYDVDFSGLISSSADMGVQASGAFMALARSAEAAEEGLLVERLTGELGFDRVNNRINQAPAMVVDYAASQLLSPVAPVDDDLLIRNDIVVSRTDGARGVRAVDENGPNGTLVRGVYDGGAVTLNVSTDDVLPHHAGWRLNIGTTDVPRLARLVIHLSRPAAWSLIEPWLSCDVGSRIQILNLPDDFSPGPLDMLLEGYTETIDQFQWVVELNLSPYLPYEVAVYAGDSGDTSDVVGHFDWDSCIIADATFLIGDSSVSVTPVPLITTDADDFPFDVMIGDERMTVTACAGAGPDQTLTITRNVNGVNQDHFQGDAVILHPDSARYGAI